MSKGRTTASPYDFTAAAWDEISENERSWNVKWAVSCLPTKRRGVWNLQVQVIDLARGADPVPVVRYAAEWPNATPQTFEAFLYGTCYRVARMVEGWGTQWAAEAAEARIQGASRR